MLCVDNIKTLFTSKQKTKNVVWSCTNTLATVIVLVFEAKKTTQESAIIIDLFKNLFGF